MPPPIIPGEGQVKREARRWVSSKEISREHFSTPSYATIAVFADGKATRENGRTFPGDVRGPHFGHVSFFSWISCTSRKPSRTFPVDKEFVDAK